jgi:hypothetical protein
MTQGHRQVRKTPPTMKQMKSRWIHHHKVSAGPVPHLNTCLSSPTIGPRAQLFDRRLSRRNKPAIP